jgi:hypothetical protein
MAASGRTDIPTFPFEMYDINIWATIGRRQPVAWLCRRV